MDMILILEFLSTWLALAMLVAWAMGPSALAWFTGEE
jgi:hypothetical protein